MKILEWTSGIVLLLVLAALAWMVVAEYLPSSWRVLSLEGEIFVALGLLTAALTFVSVLALLHTRQELRTK